MKNKNKIGTVYVIGNKAMPNLHKIGYTMRTAQERAKELSDKKSGIPYAYIVLFEAKTIYPQNVEKKVHQILSHYNEGKEWFNCTFDECVDAVKKSCDEMYENERIRLNKQKKIENEIIGKNADRFNGKFINEESVESESFKHTVLIKESEENRLIDKENQKKEFLRKEKIRHAEQDKLFDFLVQQELFKEKITGKERGTSSDFSVSQESPKEKIINEEQENGFDSLVLQNHLKDKENTIKAKNNKNEILLRISSIEKKYPYLCKNIDLEKKSSSSQEILFYSIRNILGLLSTSYPADNCKEDNGISLFFNMFCTIFAKKEYAIDAKSILDKKYIIFLVCCDADLFNKFDELLFEFCRVCYGFEVLFIKYQVVNSLKRCLYFEMGLEYLEKYEKVIYCNEDDFEKIYCNIDEDVILREVYNFEKEKCDILDYILSYNTDAACCVDEYCECEIIYIKIARVLLGDMFFSIVTKNDLMCDFFDVRTAYSRFLFVVSNNKDITSKILNLVCKIYNHNFKKHDEPNGSLYFECIKKHCLEFKDLSFI